LADDIALLGGHNIDILAGRRFALVPLTAEHHRALYELSVLDQNSFRWRFQGMVPPLDAFERSLYAGVLCQFVVVPAGQREPLLGLVVAYNANLQNGYCYLAVISDRKIGAGVLEGVALFLRYLIRNWPLRKIYLEVPEYNLGPFESAVTAGLLRQEGCFLEHHYFLNRYWDLFTYAIYREQLLEFGNRFASLFPTSPPAAPSSYQGE